MAMYNALSVNDFKNKLREEVEKICKNQNKNFDNEKSRGEAFSYWVSEFYKRNNRYIDTEPDESLLGGSSDLLCDIYLEDETNKKIWLIQTEYTGIGKKSSNQHIKEDKVINFFQNHSNLKNRDWIKKNGNKIVKEKLLDYGNYLKDNFEIKFVFISTGLASDRIKDQKDKYNKQYQKEGLEVSCELYDFSGLKELYIESLSIEQTIPELVEFEVPEDKLFVKEKPKYSIITCVKVNTIKNLYKKYQDRLFSYNIRTYLGEKGINRQILETAETEPENFFYYNNGIAAVCTQLELKKNKISAKKFQIINGAQTIGSLRSVDNDSNLEILIRITETASTSTEKGMNEKVIRFNNTQNKITLSDFRSNDPIQLELSKKFNEHKAILINKVNYLRKRGDKISRSGDYNLKLEDLAKIKYAYFHNPCHVISNAKDLWKVGENGLYNDAFGIDGEIKEILTEDQFLSNFLLPVLLYENIIRNCEEYKKKKQDLRYLKRFRYHFLYFYREIIGHFNEKTNEINFKKLNNEDKLKKFTNLAFEKISDAIIDLYIDEEDKDLYKNAPIRDLTISKDHLERLKKKILSKLVKFSNPL